MDAVQNPDGECDGQLMLPGFSDLEQGTQPQPKSSCCLGRCATPGRRPVSVWACSQQTSRFQRAGRYLPESIAHPARMLPAITRHLIHTYTDPHELVFDPMCGIGTTVIEAMHAGRGGIGVEYEPRWAHLAQRGINHARTQGATGAGYVWNADARTLPPDLVQAVTGRVRLLITSPPYGPSCHGQVVVHGRTGHTGPVAKTDHRYSKDPGNLAHHGLSELVAGFTDILTAAHPLLAPGGTVAVTARPWRRGGHLIDLPAAVERAGRIAGFTPVERCLALLGRIEPTEPDTHGRSGERMIAHPSFFQLDSARRALAAGIPRSLIAHECVQIMTKEH